MHDLSPNMSKHFEKSIIKYKIVFDFFTREQTWKGKKNTANAMIENELIHKFMKQMFSKIYIIDIGK